ncbi:ATP-binding cassette domain-containing protein [Shewanella psychrotolerans]|uniref:ATP-binding cassette domain-containing protein n=1 Tax=Shewanella psychrotolerans TaxID=2864206 RepID=UPI001C65FDCA|nr:ATP-binding cassette domain-containing protein [Shewanella psychrotolerans]QYK02827.1 ATP-binding cassette domain-containing protein [Shewanella psychrotolerans]
MLALESISLHYQDKQVIDKLSLSITQGEKLAIVGASGAGKSTLLTHIYQQLQRDAALCSQSQGLVDALSVYHNVFMGALSRHYWLYNLANLAWPFKRHLSDIKLLCDSLFLDVSLDTKVSSLSGGQRQRVAIARAIYQNQPVFIGDEAFSALDPIMAERLVELVLAKHDTVIMVLHDCALALKNFDRIIGLQQGQIAIDKPASQLSPQQLSDFFDGVAQSAVQQA